MVLRDPDRAREDLDRRRQIVYSDESRLIGESYQLGDDELEALETGGVTAELSDLAAPENRFERGHGDLLEVYTRDRDAEGHPPAVRDLPALLEHREQPERARSRPSRPSSSWRSWRSPRSRSPSRGCSRGGCSARRRDRERFLQRAVDASDRERRRIAGDLHDGPVQDLAGLSMRLSAAAEGTADAEAREVLGEAAAAARASIRTLRSAIVGVYPPNLQQAGLGPALVRPRRRDSSTRVSRSRSRSIPPDGFGPEVDELLYRACQEALRNVEAHAQATRVEVTVRREGARAVLEVADDGRGIEADAAARARERGPRGPADPRGARAGRGRRAHAASRATAAVP